MISQTLLCVTALLLGDPQATTPAEQPQNQQTVEKAQEPKPADANATPKQTEGQTPKSDKAAANAATAQKESDDRVVDGVKLAAIEANIVSYTNQERARHGLPALEVDNELMTTAREHAEWMTRNHSLVHTNRPVAENIAMGQPHSSDAVQAWMNSSGHRANILNPRHGRIGVAAFRTASGLIYWCQQFRPAASREQ